MFALVESAIEFLVPIIEALGAIVVVSGCLRAIARYLAGFLGWRPRSIARLRLELGQSLVLGLEFQVASDILTTALSPSWEELGLLAATIALRTVLDFFLVREIDALDRDVAPPGSQAEAA